MKLYQEKNRVIIDEIKDFEPKHIFECGQCFRWDKEEDGSYTGVANQRVINVKLEEDTLILDNTNMDDYHSIWHNYFDMERDYSKIKDELAKMDEHLKSATEFGYGIRLLKQDTFEMVISFIISARNAIPMIKRSVEFLSKSLGEEIGEYRGKKYYAFPTAKALSACDEQVLIDSKVAFRKDYIREASRIQSLGQMDIYGLVNLPTDEARKELMRINGVGPKVSDCILLFGLSKYDVFPVDVWVQRVMHEFYIEKEIKDLKKIREFGIEKFGDKAGIAQQYLFYYAREKGIGRK